MRAVRASVLVAAAAGAAPPSKEEIRSLWIRFQGKYPTEGGYETFKKNVIKAHWLNVESGVECGDLMDDDACSFGVTKFSHLTEEEFSAQHLGFTKVRGARNQTRAMNDELPEAPDAVDWREKKAVTKVKDQGSCGSCYAFSAVEAVESGVFMGTGKLTALSTQQVVACDKGDGGCAGGDPPVVYKYIKKAGGLATADQYPDTSSSGGRRGKCKAGKPKYAKLTSWSYAVKPCDSGACRKQDEEGLAKVVAAKGPLSICVNAGSGGWQSYKRGVYSAKCSGKADDLDHCVQLVGFNKQGPKPYWIVRNSWNTDWGVKGYMYLEMGKNLCGVADEATLVQATLATEEGLVV